VDFSTLSINCAKPVVHSAMGAASSQAPTNAVGPGPAGNNATAWQTQHGHMASQQFPNPPQVPVNTQGMVAGNQGRRMSNPGPQSSMTPDNPLTTHWSSMTPDARRMSDPGCSTVANGQQTWSWASDLTAMVPQALKSLYEGGLPGLEAKLKSAFQGLSPEQEVNVEAKLLASLEREKQAAVEREDYITASHYKLEIDALCYKANKQSSKAASFVRAASFMTTAHASKGKGKGNDYANNDMSTYTETVGKGKGKSKGYGSSTASFDLASFQERARGVGKGTVNESFARRERAMANATDPNFRASFMTDAAQAGSFPSPGSPSPTFQNEARGCKSSFAAPRSDASFSAGLPRSAAHAGQPQLPTGVSFTNTTKQPSSGGSNIQQTSTSSFADYSQGYTTHQPPADWSPGGGCTTQRPFTGDNTRGPCAPSFQTRVPMSNSFATTWSTAGLRPITEF